MLGGSHVVGTTRGSIVVAGDVSAEVDADVAAASDRVRDSSNKNRVTVVMVEKLDNDGLAVTGVQAKVNQ
jgi:hypothetical protein